MASYHFYAQIIGRGDRRSAVAAAAYRSASRIVDRATGQVHDYTRKRGVVHSEILLPQGTPTWLADRTKLWNHVQAVEKRKDAQYAREINLALPHELTRDQRLDLLRSFAKTEFVAKGMIADIAMHEPVLDRGEDARNCHAHIMLTLRQGTRDGLSLTKTRSWNAKSELKSWRAVWAEHQNRMLADHHHNARVDHRSLADQHAEALVERDIPRARMLERVPEIHVGPAAMEMAKASKRPRALQPMPLSPPPVATLLQPPARAMPPPTPSIGRQVHRAETRLTHAAGHHPPAAGTGSSAATTTAADRASAQTADNAA